MTNKAKVEVLYTGDSPILEKGKWLHWKSYKNEKAALKAKQTLERGFSKKSGYEFRVVVK